MTEAATLTPASAEAVLDLLQAALAERRPLEVVGAGSKRRLGRPMQTAGCLDLSGVSGITLYEPEELVLTARAGTSLGEIGAALAARRQRLAFEPPDLGPLLGAAAGRGTLGGAIACNLSGPRRPFAGAARDHLLGFKAVSGRAEAFKSGGRVVKNVTGFDLSKLMAGSYGTLAVLTEATLKVLPAAEASASLVLSGLDLASAAAAMTRALGGPFEVSGAAHLPAAVGRLSAVGAVAGLGGAATVLRLEGPAPSIAARAAALRKALGPMAATEIATTESEALWAEIRDVRFFAADPASPQAADAVWRLTLAPSSAPAVVAGLSGLSGNRHYLDWGGGLVWLAVPPAADGGAEAVRTAVGGAGRATLMRAPEAVRRSVAVFPPEPPALAALHRRVKEAFDPYRLLNPQRLDMNL